MKPEDDGSSPPSPLDGDYNGSDEEINVSDKTPFIGREDPFKIRQRNISVSRFVPALKPRKSVQEDIVNRLNFFSSSFLTSDLSAPLKSESVVTNVSM